MARIPSLFPIFTCHMNFPWCVDSLWRRDEESKKGHKHNTTQNTHTSLCQELAQVPLMTKFSNLLEARCLIDSIQWASSSPRPAKAGRQAGSMCFIQDPIPKVPFRCYVWSFFLFGWFHLPSGQWFLLSNIFFLFFNKNLEFFGKELFFF